MVAHLQVGEPQPPEKAEAVDRRAATSAGSTGSGTTGGCSVTATAAAHLVKFSWTNIVRHDMVKGAASPDDPALAGYWASRRREVNPPFDRYTLRLLTRQDGRCPLCGDHLLTADQPPQSPQRVGTMVAAGHPKAIAASYLVHHGRRARRTGTEPASYTPPATAGCWLASAGNQHEPQRPRGLLEPSAGKPARSVLRGPRRSNAPGATRPSRC